MYTKVASMFIFLGICLGMNVAVSANDEYIFSPANQILCTIHAPDSDGTRNAVGTDFTDDHKIYMEIIDVGGDGIVRHVWTLNRDTSVTSEGGYDVFKQHCAPIMKLIPAELGKKFEGFFPTPPVAAPIATPVPTIATPASISATAEPVRVPSKEKKVTKSKKKTKGKKKL